MYEPKVTTQQLITALEGSISGLTNVANLSTLARIKHPYTGVTVAAIQVAVDSLIEQTSRLIRDLEAHKRQVLNEVSEFASMPSELSVIIQDQRSTNGGGCNNG